MFPRRGAMQQHLKSHAATCTEQSHWLHSGYTVVTTSVTLDTRSNNTDKSGRQTANAGHAQQQHRQKRQTNRQRWARAATTQTKAADKPPTQQNTCSNNTNGCLLQLLPPIMCTTVCLPAEPAITTLSKRARKVSPDEVSALHTDSSSEDHCVEMNLPCQRCINHESRFRVSPAQPRLD